MPILTITEFGNPILRRKARKVSLKITLLPEFKKLISEMFKTCRKLGVGLAAPQIGLPLQLAVIEVPKNDTRAGGGGYPPTVLINPRIVAHAKEKVLGYEGCLSCPGVRGEVSRYKWVKVRYFDQNGKEKTVTARGFPAKVFQHEIDHLNGIVYVDRMKNLKTLITENEYLHRSR